MSSCLQVLADLEATVEEGEELARQVVDRLVSSGIIQTVDGSQGTVVYRKYVSGPNYLRAVDFPGTATSAATKDFEVEVGRTVFWDASGPESMRCPHCATSIPLQGGVDAEANWGRVSAVIDEWSESGDGLYQCPSCGTPIMLNDWQWTPFWGFGHLGFIFTDWPKLSSGFVEDLSSLLEHHLVYQAYKI